MCGIIGAFTKSKPIIDRLDEACSLLYHRGPDEEGRYDTEDMHMRFRRLAIIDIATGSQPVISEDGNHIVMFNGEIYNFVALRRDLEKEGYRFKTKGDAEVVLNMFLKYGPEMVQYLNGIFAIVVYNCKNKELFLFRDHVGVKPLFYSEGVFGFAYSSELNALRHLLGDLMIDKEIICHYLSMLYIPAPWTIYKQVKSLEPGCYLRYKDNKINQVQYWKLDFVEERRDGLEELVEDTLCNAIENQLISERPLGAFLSGGVDSSLIALFAKSKTFSVVVKDKKHDERRYARAIAEKIKSEHYEIELPKIDIRLLDKVISLYGQPFADTSMLPMYVISELISKHVTVALSGEGGDELFCGYEYRYLQALKNGKENSDFFDSVYFRVGEDFKRQYLKSCQESTYSLLLRQLGVDSSLSKTKIMRLLDTRYFLEGDILQKADISGMAHSMEVRVPFLCQNMLKMASTLPEEVLFDKGCTKKILKKILAKKMPHDFVYRPKVGLNLPIQKWIGEIANNLYNGFPNDPVWQLNIFNLDTISVFLNHSRHGRRTERRPHNYESASFIFAIWVLNIWLKNRRY